MCASREVFGDRYVQEKDGNRYDSLASQTIAMVVGGAFPSCLL